VRKTLTDVHSYSAVFCAYILLSVVALLLHDDVWYNGYTIAWRLPEQQGYVTLAALSGLTERSEALLPSGGASKLSPGLRHIPIRRLL
jgi:hypothetical protein